MNFYGTQNAQAFQAMHIFHGFDHDICNINPDSQKKAFGKNLLLLETSCLWYIGTTTLRMRYVKKIVIHERI